MIHMLSRFDLKPGVDASSFQKSYEAFVEHMQVASSVQEIPSEVFESDVHLQLQSITFPDSVTRFNEGCFTKCYRLTRVSIPSGVFYFENAFNRNHLEHIDIHGDPDNLALALRLNVFYPNATSHFAMDRLVAI